MEILFGFAGPILMLVIIFWAFGSILRPFMPKGPGFSSSHPGGQGVGCISGLVYGLVFSVLMPAMWWTIGFVTRGLQRAFVVFTEFVTGIHDWQTYRTSSFKYLGAASAFLGYNFLLLTILMGFGLMLGAGASGDLNHAYLIFSSLFGSAVLFSVLARLLMRRMP